MNHLRIEVAIARALISAAGKGGWRLTHVFDGEENVTTPTTDAALSLIFNLDDAVLTFAHAGSRTQRVQLILGNGQDIISDYSCGDEAFNAIVDGVCDRVEDIALRGRCDAPRWAWDNGPDRGGHGVCIRCGFSEEHGQVRT